jgi:hypothetical protein
MLAAGGLLAATGVAGLRATAASAAAPPELALKVLLVGQGSSDLTTAAWKAALTSEGVSYTEVTAVGSAGSQTVTLPALTTGTTGNYNGVVIADSPANYAAGALSALFSYESSFGVRQVDGYMYPSPALGVTDATSGVLDGSTATLTAAGLAAFPELKGPIPFDTGSYGYGATADAGAPYTPLLTDAAGHAMAGVYQHPSTGDPQAGVSELALTFDYNASMLQWLLLAPGLVNWVTQDTHLGLYRNYFGQDIDDLFIADNEWSQQFQCTPAATDPPDYTCPAGVANNPADTPPDVQMSAADVAYVVNWQQQTGIRLNLLFNAIGACTADTAGDQSNANCTGSVTENGATYTDPGQVVDPSYPNDAGFVNALLADQSSFYWETHTWSHQFLGCIVWQPQALSAAAASSSGGTFAAGSYSYEVTAATAYGESEPSLPKAVTVGTDGSVNLTWPEASNGIGADGTPGPSLAQEEASHTGGTGFWGYYIYREDPGSTSYGLVGQVPENTAATSSTTYSFTDTGVTTGAAPNSGPGFPTATNPGMDCSSAPGSWLPATSTTPDSSIEQEIGLDQAFAAANGLTNYTPAAVVTGEHSGIENPNMPAALAGVGVTTFAQDASRQPQQYSLGAALGAPRYPSNIYYNASNWADELNEYNTLYVAQGASLGSTQYPGDTGHCTDTSSTTCITTPATEADLLKSESHIMLSHVLGNDPRVGYAHQSDLIGPATLNGQDYGYTILTLISDMLSQYNAWYAAPLAPVTDVTDAQVLAEQGAWATADKGGQVTATEQNGVVTVTNNGSAVGIPVTVPAGTTVNGAAFGQSYGGTLSDWVNLGTGATQTLTEHVGPAILSATSATSIVGAPFSFTVTTTGAPAAAITQTGALPAGLTFTDNGDGTATIAGTATAGSGGSYPIKILATNSVGGASQSFTLTNTEAPSITSPSTATFSTGVAGSYAVTTTGYPAAAITEAGALPTGMSFTDNGNGTGSIAGTPASGTAGSYPVTLSATNSSGSTATLSLTITVNASAAPTITSGSVADFTLNQAGAVAVSTTGSPTPAITETGALPAGLSFTDNGNGTALISGTPTATGTTTLSINASNGISPDATQTFTLVVGQAPAFTSANSATATTGSAFSYTVTAGGYPAPDWGESNLPPGVTFTDNKDGTATLAGTPTTAGTYAVPLVATNAYGSVQQTLTITVQQAPAITSGGAATFAAAQAGTFTVTASGVPAPALSATSTPALPSGVTFKDNGNGTATLAGTPAAGSQGSYTLTIAAKNSAGTAAQSFALTVTSGVAITSASASTGTAGRAFSFTVTATGTPTPTLTRTGTLPTGVTFTAHTNGTATLAGTPAAAARGLYPLTFTARNSAGTTSQAFTLTVNQVPSFSSGAAVTETAGTAFGFTVMTAGYPTPKLSGGSLPAGVSFSDNGNGSGVLSGTTAVRAGTYRVAIAAANAAGTASQTITLTVRAATGIRPVPTFTSAAAASGTAGRAFTFTVTTVGSPTSYVTNVTHSGTLPAGVSFTNRGNGTATLSGTPTAASSGTYPITLTASNTGGTTTQSFVLTVSAVPAARNSVGAATQSFTLRVSRP